MRKLPLGVALSAAVHGATVAWLATRAFGPRPSAEAATTTPIEIVSIERAAAPPEPREPPAPVDEAQVAAVEPPASQRPRVHRPAPPAAAAIAAGATPSAAATTEPAPAPDATAPRVGLLGMRRGEAPRLELPAGRWDDLEHAPRGTRPAREARSGALQESGGGSYKSDQDVFTGKVNPDGTVDLRDARNFQIHLALPTPKMLGRALAGWYESDKGASGREGDTAMAKQIQVSSGASTDPGDTGKPEHYLKDSHTTVIVPVIGGRFDVTDWLTRSTGGDPYASRKLAFLDATRDERVAIGNRHRDRQLALTPQIIQRNLDALWARTPEPAARKQALFEMWDECAETGDPRVVAGGEAARRLVIGFIRARLPAGGPDAFTPDELAALARRKQSKASFQPYDDAPPP